MLPRAAPARPQEHADAGPVEARPRQQRISKDEPHGVALSRKGDAQQAAHSAVGAIAGAEEGCSDAGGGRGRPVGGWRGGGVVLGRAVLHSGDDGVVAAAILLAVVQ